MALSATQPTKHCEVLKFISSLINNKVTGADCLFQTSCFLVKKTESVLEIYKNVRIIERLCSVDSLYRDDQVIVSFCIYKLFPNWD